MSVLSARRILVEAAPRAGGPESVPALPAGVEAATPGWLAAAPRPVPGEHPWDAAHRAVRAPADARLESLGLPADGSLYAEPDFEQEFPVERPHDRGLESFDAAGPCARRGPDDFWPVGDPAFGWHLDDTHSGLRAARTAVGQNGRPVRVVHLDTGYDPSHVTLPERMVLEQQRNFGGDPGDATDPGSHFPLNQPGHGTGTLALLAGKRVRIDPGGFDDYLGGAPFARVIPVRIADSVVHFLTSNMALGINYAADVGCDVVSLSMGGVPARAWAAAVNRAYEAGIAIFAAAGNRFGPSPPATIVYPARFNRVTAVCGVASDRTPYYRPGLHTHMQGCFGPPAKMATALAAYTPNAPWAVMGCAGLVNFGGGTSAATPQAAAAAALWLQAVTPPAGVAPWQRVEAVRHALFASAGTDVSDRQTYFGNGRLRAAEALRMPFRDDLAMTPADTVSFPWLRLIGTLEAVGPTAAPEPPGEQLMYEVEALQIFLQSPNLQKVAGGADPASDPLPPADRKKLVDGLRRSPLASAALCKHLNDVYPRL